MCDDEYTIADIAIWAWYGGLVLYNTYEATQFLDATSYKHLSRWAHEIQQRPA